MVLMLLISSAQAEFLLSAKLKKLIIDSNISMAQNNKGKSIYSILNFR